MRSGARKVVRESGVVLLALQRVRSEVTDGMNVGSMVRIRCEEMENGVIGGGDGENFENCAE